MYRCQIVREFFEERKAAMIDLYRSGKTLAEIGATYGISRERVRQVTALGASKGGQFQRNILRQIQKHEARAAKRNARYQRLFGCSRDAYLQITGDEFIWNHSKKPVKGFYRTPGGAYMNQKRNAQTRGIEWEMTFPEWWQIWNESGKWHLRGRGKGYCMARLGDSGPYSPQNVYICTIGQNFSDSYLVKPWHTRFKGSPAHFPAKPFRVEIGRESKTNPYKLWVYKKYVGRFPTMEAAQLRGGELTA